MNILLIAPVPPPITGHSLATSVLLDHLSDRHEVNVVNLSKESTKDGEIRLDRVLDVIKILGDTWRSQKSVDAIYLTISESAAGNLKDLFIYLICMKKLSRMYIHLHGGSIGKLLFDKYKLISRLNRFFIARLGGVIVSGDSHLKIFADMIPQAKIHVVPNFATDDLFVPVEDIRKKFSRLDPLRIVYISSLQHGKGYNQLADAYLMLSETLRTRIRIDFAGRVESEAHKQAFLAKISAAEQIRYHGVISKEEKKRLFSQAHVFCLPTTFLEGQPISILEAYASGCVVVTTCPPGIRDVYQAGVNGIGLADGSAETIKKALEALVARPEDLSTSALTNRETAAQRYRTATFGARLRTIIENSRQLSLAN